MSGGGARRVGNGVELGAVVEDELCEGGEAGEGGAPGGGVGGDVPEPAAVLEGQALQAPQLPQTCTCRYREH